jgi:DNA replication and repair protein RecF
MRVEELSLEAYRNYASAHAVFHPGMNIICGENAQGKTNLMEAIAYLSGAKSHRTRYDRELIAFGANLAFLNGKVFCRERSFGVDITLSAQGRRKITRNGVRLKSAAALGETLNTVLFCPEDLNLIRAGALERRRFLDDTISQLRPRYAEALERYQKAWKEKSFILNHQEERPDLLSALEDFSLQLCRYGAVITHYRAHLIRRLGETAPAIHREFSGDREQLTLFYEADSAITDPLAPTSVLLEQLLEHQQRHRQTELSARKCLVGPHRDELRVEIDGRSARQFASQGQTRTAALSLKLAQRDIIYADRGEYPVLLLDDVLSELDPRRQEFVLNHIQGGQVFLTCCEEERLACLQEGKVFVIQNGTIQEER